MIAENVNGTFCNSIIWKMLWKTWMAMSNSYVYLAQFNMTIAFVQNFVNVELSSTLIFHTLHSCFDFIEFFVSKSQTFLCHILQVFHVYSLVAALCFRLKNMNVFFVLIGDYVPTYFENLQIEFCCSTIQPHKVFKTYHSIL